MIKRGKFSVIIMLMVFIMVLGLGDRFIFGEEDVLRRQGQIDQFDKPIKPDYTNINDIIDEVLDAYPTVRSEINSAKSMSTNEIHHALNDESIIDLLNIEKRAFRLEVDSRLTNQKMTTDLNRAAEEYTKNYLEALWIAENVYNVVITQDEVTRYIDQHVSPIIIEQKEVYAKALGLTLEQLDYKFDRDIYVMDVLWGKLIPVLMDEYPQGDDGTSNDYQDRLKETFYSQNK